MKNGDIYTKGISKHNFYAKTKKKKQENKFRSNNFVEFSSTNFTSNVILSTNVTLLCANSPDHCSASKVV